MNLEEAKERIEKLEATVELLAPLVLSKDVAVAKRFTATLIRNYRFPVALQVAARCLLKSCNDIIKLRKQRQK